VPDPHEADPVPHDSNLGIAGGDYPILYNRDVVASATERSSVA
jgi:hypothetical protein